MKLKKKSDEECMDLFTQLLDERVNVTTRFVLNDKSNIISHQMLVISCGDVARVSQAVELDTPLMIAPVKDLGVTIN